MSLVTIEETWFENLEELVDNFDGDLEALNHFCSDEDEMISILLFEAKGKFMWARNKNGQIVVWDLTNVSEVPLGKDGANFSNLFWD